MKRLLLRAGLSLLGILFVAAVVIYGLSQRQLARHYTFAVRAPTVPTDPLSLQRGEHVVMAVLDCQGCHGADHGGMWMLKSGALGKIGGGNLTAGRGSVVSGYTDVDWVRAIRHGVSRDGRPLLMMSADAYGALSDADLGVAIAYLKTLPPVDREQPPSRPGPLGRLLFLLGALPLPAATLDHQAVEESHTPAVGPTAEYGHYLAVTSGCYGCHGELLGGRQLGPEAHSSNITAAALSSWSEQEFELALRQGVSRGGRQLGPMMPSQRAFSRLSAVEMKALWLWSRGQPVAPNPR